MPTLCAFADAQPAVCCIAIPLPHESLHPGWSPPPPPLSPASALATLSSACLAWDTAVAASHNASAAASHDAAVLALQGVVNTHAAGWSHLDLKPENICVEWPEDGGPTAFLVDFGSGHPLDQSELNNLYGLHWACN